MNKLLAACVVLLAICVVPAPADYCNGRDFNYDFDWSCSFGCCYNFERCCLSAGYYWYAWVIVTLFFLVCFCACAGCGGYGYRRYYVVRRVQYPPPAAATVVTTTATQGQGYQQFANQYQPYSPPKDAPPPYNPAATGKY